MKQKMDTSRLRVIDLFTGCGGFSYGFQLAGLQIETGIEINKKACYTASYNLFWKHGIRRDHVNKNIEDVSAEYLKLDSGLTKITIGGPPCQAYSRIGQPKLRSLGEERYGLRDKRAFLYKEFIRLGVELDSAAIVMENVPESVNFFGINIPQIVCEILEQNGYNAIWTILNAADYGVPQTRERVFVIAIKKEIGNVVYLPEPSHFNSLGLTGREILAKYKRMTEFENFRLPLVAEENAPRWVTVYDALSDLPVLFPSSNSKYVLRKIETKLPYQTPPINEFQKKMRMKSDGSYTTMVDANCFRNTPRDFRIFERMDHGDNYSDAHKIALELFYDACRYYGISEEDEEEYNKLFKEYVPPYDTTKFLSKWKRLDPDKPSHTLVAHLGTDTYSHIHPFEPRGISVREAARLQSFPDDFSFNSSSMSDAFKQIGNAVPPLLAKAVAEAVIKNLNK